MDDVKKAVNVDQDREKFMAFGDKPAILASKGFAECIGAVIAKGNSAIVAHYTDSDTGLSQAEDKLASLINEHKQSLEGGQAWLYAHVRPYKPDVYISEDNNKRLEKVIKDNTGITPVRVKYIEPEDLMADEQGEFKKDEDMPKELLHGAMMVKHSGQPNETPRVIFVNLDWQRAASEGRS
ncbi:hypothetical protein NUU61_008530 [Penicillium alfredii]|uniref:Uncharacterized protein n=1 Tax=Penicillium alfredii TaxID=1506179 RepID=A0A9W9ELL1_9EURO|nr:uncharacterized protein NUU61_008530 [Penicillium alfredii]KAJ5083951.1 hypothetical protein NUU61_008530 [Penicillium alfredii]